MDYWDYIGWADSFANPDFTERQKAYAQALDERMIFTPQFIVNGVESSFGGQSAEVASLIQKYAQLVPGAELSIRRMGASYEITLQNVYYSSPYDVYLVGVSPLESVDIHSGQNAGRRVNYANIVTEWHNLGLWDGLRPTTFETGVLGGRYIVLL